MAQDLQNVISHDKYHIACYTTCYTFTRGYNVLYTIMCNFKFWQLSTTSSSECRELV